MAQNILIKAVDKRGDCAFFQKMSSPIMAEMVFHGLTHDAVSVGEDLNWYLLADGEAIMWHCPNRMISE